VNVAKQLFAWVGTLGLVLALVTGCAVGGDAPTSDPPRVTAAPADQDLVGRWVDGSGRELPDATAASSGILVLHVNSDLGRRTTSVGAPIGDGGP
jgi:hypothetical protein